MADVDLEAPSPDQRNALCARFPFLATPYAAAFPLHEAARCNDWRTLNDLVLAQPPVDINVRDRRRGQHGIARCRGCLCH